MIPNYVFPLSSVSLGAAIETTVVNIASPTELNALGTTQGEIRLARTTEVGTGTQTWYYLDTTSDAQSLPYIVGSLTAGLKWIAFGGRYVNEAVNVRGILTAASSLSVSSAATVTGLLTCSAGLSVTSAASVGGLLTCSSGLSVTSNTTHTGTTNCTGLLTCSSGLSVTSTVALTIPLASTSGGTGVNNAGTITNASNTVITGGGTLALAGFTLTVPATGTTALLATANAFTAAQTITASSGLTVLAAATQDALQITGRAGGTSSFIGTFVPGTLTASRTYTLPDLTGTAVLAATATIAGTRVPFGNGSGIVTTDAGLTYGSATPTLTVGTGSTADALLALNTAAGQNRGVYFRTASSNRWLLEVDNVAESGSDAGSNFNLRARTDAGAAIDTPLSIARASGGTLTIARPTSFTNTTDSTTKDTGSIVTEGGIGAEKSIFSGAMVAAGASTTSLASMRLPHGSAPSSPVNGDMWTTTAGLFVRINGATVGPLS